MAKSSKVCFVYYLLDPRTSCCAPNEGDKVYVGITKDPGKRHFGHIIEAIKDKIRTLKLSWIRSLRSADLIPRLVVKCVLENETEAKRVEVALIAALRRKGCDLKNGTQGGDGVVDPSAEVRANMSNSHKGRPWSPARRAATEARKGTLTEKQVASYKKHRETYHHSTETRAKMSAAHKGKEKTPEHLANISKALKGRTASKSQRANLSKGWKREMTR